MHKFDPNVQGDQRGHELTKFMNEEEEQEQRKHHPLEAPGSTLDHGNPVAKDSGGFFFFFFNFFFYIHLKRKNLKTYVHYLQVGINRLLIFVDLLSSYHRTRWYSSESAQARSFR